MSKKKSNIPTFQAEPSSKKRSRKFYITILLGVILFFFVIYPRFVPILAKYTVVNHLSKNGQSIAEYDFSDIEYSNEKNAYIISLTEKSTGSKREIGVGTKFLPTHVEFDHGK